MNTLSENKKLAESWLQLVCQSRINDICAITSPTWRLYGGPTYTPTGWEGVLYLFNRFDPVYNDWTADMVLADGDHVVVRATNPRIHSSLFGIPALGHAQALTCTFIHRIADGLLEETWIMQTIMSA
jgi:hypothetical protein